MAHTTLQDGKTGRKFYLDEPDDLKPDEPVTFILNLHGGGSVGAWQRLYFPAQDYADKYRLVIATPSAATKEPARRWVGARACWSRSWRASASRTDGRAASPPGWKGSAPRR